MAACNSKRSSRNSYDIKKCSNEKKKCINYKENTEKSRLKPTKCCKIKCPVNCCDPSRGNFYNNYNVDYRVGGFDMNCKLPVVHQFSKRRDEKNICPQRSPDPNEFMNDLTSRERENACSENCGNIEDLIRILKKCADSCSKAKRKFEHAAKKQKNTCPNDDISTYDPRFDNFYNNYNLDYKDAYKCNYVKKGLKHKRITP